MRMLSLLCPSRLCVNFCNRAFRYLRRLDRAMKKVIPLCTVLSLSACIPPTASLRAKPPALDLTSSLSAKQVALCIADHWENAPYHGRETLPLTMRPTADGYVVTMTGYGARFLAEVKHIPNGSRTQYFFGLSDLYNLDNQGKDKDTTMKGIVTTCQ